MSVFKGCRMGVEAVLALMEADPDSEPRVITLNSLRSIRLPLMQCVEKTHAVAKALDENDYELARKLRGRYVFLCLLLLVEVINCWSFLL